MNDLHAVKIDELLRDKCARRDWLKSDLEKCMESDNNPRTVSNAIAIRKDLDALNADIKSLEKLKRLVVDECAPVYDVAPPAN